MYMLDEFIDTGITDGVVTDETRKLWPSEMHRDVACNIVLCNPNVTTRDMLTAICKAVCKVPQNKIEKVSYNQLVHVYKMPRVCP